MKPTKTIPVLVAAGAAGVLLSACIPSVNPFYTAQDLRFDPQLLGEWQQQSDREQTWKFERGGDQQYQLTVTEKGNKKGTCEAHLLKLKDEWFLDIIPSDCKFAAEQAELVQAAVFAGHLLVRVSRSDTELKLAFFDFEWLQKHLQANPRALAHHVEGERILLTARTRALQRFVLQHLGEGGLFQKYEAFARP